MNIVMVITSHIVTSQNLIGEILFIIYSLLAGLCPLVDALF
jgi:hypothetical protein